MSCEESQDIEKDSIFTSAKEPLIKGGLQSLDWTGGLDRWTGLVDWTSGLIEIVCKPLPGMNFDSVG